MKNDYLKGLSYVKVRLFQRLTGSRNSLSVVAGGSSTSLYKPMRLKQDSLLLQRKLQATFIAYLCLM